MRLVGNATDVNRTTGEVTGSHDFDHIYDYISFHVGPPPDSVFVRPCGMVCYSTNATWDPTTLPAADCASACPATGIQDPPTTHDPVWLEPVDVPDGAYQGQIAVE